MIDRTVVVEEEAFYMVHVAWSGCVFVKTLAFFCKQGGFRDDWGKHWMPIAATSIEDARRKGCLLEGARPYHQQVEP